MNNTAQIKQKTKKWLNRKICKLNIPYPMFPEFPDDGFMHKELDIFR